MRSSPPSFFLGLAVVLGALGLGLWSLMFGFANDLTGATLVAAHPESDVVLGKRDPGGKSTIAMVEALPLAEWKRPRRSVIFVPGNEVLWLRVTLRNVTDRRVNGVLSMGYYFIDRVDAWAEGQNLSEPQRSGEKLKQAEKSVRGRDGAVLLEIAPGEERVVYLRCEDACGGTFNLWWWPEAQDYFTAQSSQLLAEGIYYGGLLALLVYNLVLWLRLRFADTGFYVLHLASVLGFVLLARGHLALLDWRIASPQLETLLVLTLVAEASCLTQFARAFLQMREKDRWGDRVARGLQLGLGLAAAGALTIPWTNYTGWMVVATAGATLTHVLLLVIAVRAWLRGVRAARFFVLSFGCLFVGALPLGVIWLSGAVVPSAGLFGLMVGSAMEMLMLSLALADRFAQAQRDKALAQQNLVEATEQRRAIQEAYADELAVEVRERTKELEATNADKDRMIAVIGHDLRSPLTSLMQTAEQLALPPQNVDALKRFAADSAQVGRQTLLLIEDLVLWARLRAGMRSPPGRHEVHALVAPVVALHRAFAGQRGIELAVDVPGELRLTTDLVLAQTLLRNLVANALKFARTRIEVRAVAEDGSVRLTVWDDGPGLPAEVMAAFAKEFPEPANAAGGLGLRLCVEISRALGSTLQVKLMREGGTEFQVKLPL